jgi:uncharacterized membrane protein
VYEEDYWSEAIALNNHGQVVGVSSTNFTDRHGSSIEHAFFWEDVNGNGVSEPGEMSDLVPGGGSHYGDVADINDRGEVVGEWSGNNFSYRETFIRRPDGQFLGLGDDFQVRAMNDQGMMTGSTVISTPTGDAGRAFRRPAGGPMEIIGTFGGAGSGGSGVNNHGHVVGGASTGEVGQTVGFKAFVSRSGTEPTPLISPINPLTGQPSTWQSTAIDINDAGWIAGWYWSVWGFRTVVWSPTGAVSDIGGAANENTYPRAINNGGAIVGYADPHPNNRFNYAYLTNTFGGMIDLNTVLPPNSGWHLLVANDINDRGEIVGTALVNNREQRAYMLTTVPAPARPSAVPAAAAPPAPPVTPNPRTALPPRRGHYGDGTASTGIPAAPTAPQETVEAPTCATSLLRETGGALLEADPGM